MKKGLKAISMMLVLVMLLFAVGCGSAPKQAEGSADAPATPAPSTETEKKVDFPKKPLEIIVGYAAGGANHLAAENLKPEAQEFFGVPMTVTAKPGAASAVANSFVAAAAADGYTLLNATLSLPISLYTGTVDFKKEDFVGIAMYSNVTPCMVVRADLPVNTLAELVEYANANPDTFTWGHSGVASTLHLAGCNMLNSMGIYDKVKEMPFTGTNEAVAQVLGGHIDAVLSFPSTVQEQVKAGNLKVLGVSSTERVAEFPDAPTFVEAGYDAVLTSSRGIFVRSDTPQEVLDILEAGFEGIIKSEEFKERAIKLGEPPVYMNSKDFTALYYDQCDKIGDMVEKLGLNSSGK
jgi:tripartite-type tricarboxylate transporter receptor subunit TctC